MERKGFPGGYKPIVKSTVQLKIAVESLELE